MSVTCLSTFEIGVKLLVFFTFFINFFYENINQEHNLLPDCALGPFTYVCCENCMSGFSAFILNLSKSGNILFRSMPNRNYSAQHQLSLVGDNALVMVHELRVMAAVELHVNTTYYAQHPALKSVYGKRQSVIGGKLFSSYMTVFELAQGLPQHVT